jgi:peroxiredoxin
MANDLTGDFDVVVQFSVPAINRILAAMHRLERFPHSISARVEDNHPPGALPEHPTLVSAVDSMGEAVSNHQRIGRPHLMSGAIATTGSYSALDGIVNLHLSGVSIEPLPPSQFQGRVQLQIFPPTIEIADSSGNRIAIVMHMLVRYFPDPGTNRAAEFIRGALHLTASVNQVASQNGRVLDIDLKGANVGVKFTPEWSSTPLSAQDIAGIELFIRNSLKTSFLPSNSPLPSNISKVQFRTLTGGPGAAAMLLNLNEGAGNPASANKVFLGPSDQFAFGVGADFVNAAFQPTLDGILSKPLADVKFDLDAYFHTWHITYNITMTSATVALEAGRIVMTFKGHAHTGRSWLPDFDYTARQILTLAVDGATADIVVGDISLDTTSTIANLFKSGAISNIKKTRDDAIEENDVHGTVREMLDAYAQLGGFLESLLKPARTRRFMPRGFALAYSSAEISPSGIVLHGLLSVPPWPAPHVEYEQLPPDTNAQPGLGAAVGALEGPDYSALRSWIPGGTVQRYEWKHFGETQPGFSDENRFVLIHSPPTSTEGGATDGGSGGSGPGLGPHGIHVSDLAVATVGGLDHSTLCLAVHGTRLSAAGAVVAEPVTASICGYRSFPIPGDFEIGEDGDFPIIALTRRGNNGLVEVTGHTAARADRTGSGAPNLVVHFADGTTPDVAGTLSDALNESKRGAEAPTAIVVVAPADRLSQMQHASGVTFAEDDDGSWRRRFGVSGGRGAMTLVVAPDGRVVSTHEGNPDKATLGKTLAKSLVSRTPVRASLLRTGTRSGQPAPNFLFEYAPGHQITLSKLAGRPALLLFYRPSAKPSEEALRELSSKAREMNGNGPMILAISDGKDSTSAMKSSSQTAPPPVTFVPDPDRKIAAAYGVTVWPTTLFVDALGFVSDTSYEHDGRKSAQ